jgi:hypothetical protein
MYIESTPALLQALSARLLRDLPRAVWNEVFAQSQDSGIHFEQQAVTLVHAALDRERAARWRADAAQEVNWVAGCHEGEAEKAAGGYVMRFRTPRSALRSALVLQRIAPQDAFRIGICGGTCPLASFFAQGRAWSVSLGDLAQRAHEVAASAVPGTIALAAESCEALGPLLEEEVGSGLISLEFDGAAVAQATIIPPRPNAAQSTFAGLGRF